MSTSIDRTRHHRENVPCYCIHITCKPVSLQSKRERKKEHKQKITDEARKAISSVSSLINKPISSNDIEIEISWGTHSVRGMRQDIDNILKPILDALISIVYNDDRLVRGIVVNRIDLTVKNKLAGMAETILPMGKYEDSYEIAIFSDIRLNELGGAKKVEEWRSKRDCADNENK